MAASIAEMEELSNNAMCTIMSILKVDSTIRILFANHIRNICCNHACRNDI